MNFAIKTFNELTIDELYEIVKSRFEVFVCEQKIVEDQEFDDKDKVSYHIMLKENDKVVAYCRIVPKEIGYDYTSIGRVLVLSSYRRKGIAQEMIKVALDFIKNNLNENTYKSMKKKIYQNINDYLKEVFEMAGKNDTIYIVSEFESNLDYKTKRRLSPVIKFEKDGYFYYLHHAQIGRSIQNSRQSICYARWKNDRNI